MVAAGTSTPSTVTPPAALAVAGLYLMIAPMGVLPRYIRTFCAAPSVSTAIDDAAKYRTRLAAEVGVMFAVTFVEVGEALLEVQFCAGCKRAQYCSAACQKAAWKQHKSACKAEAARLAS